MSPLGAAGGRLCVAVDRLPCDAARIRISILIYAVCCIPLVFVIIGAPLLILLGLGSLVLAIVATIKAADGQCYRYPLTLRLVS